FVRATEHIDLPRSAGVFDPVTDLLDHGRDAQLEHRIGVRDRDLVLELGTSRPVRAALDRDVAVPARPPDPDGALRVGREITLPIRDPGDVVEEHAIADQELALDLDAHAAHSSRDCSNIAM